MSTSAAVDLSIIIVNWNVCDFLDRCLDSIAENVTGISYETIVVDNASRDGSVSMVRDKHPGVRLIANTENAGFCRANNQGIEIARGRYVVLLNPDTEVYAGSMETLVEFLEAHNNVGIAGPMLLAPEGITAPNGTRFTTLLRELLGTTGLIGFFKDYHHRSAYGRDDFSASMQVDVVCGACLMTRRDVIDQIGGLDERIFMFYDEPDFCRRAKQAGWSTWYVAEAKVFHHWMQSVKQDNLNATRRYFRAQYFYFRKHHGLIPALTIRAVSSVALLFRSARIMQYRLRCRIAGALRREPVA